MQNAEDSDIACPQCGSKRLYKDGLRYSADGTAVQRWLCRECAYRFTDPNHTKRSLNSLSGTQHVETIDTLILKGEDAENYTECSSEGSAVSEPRKTKPLTMAEAMEGWDPPGRGSVMALKEKALGEKRDAGAAGKSLKPNVESCIFNFKWNLKKEGYSEATIEGYGYILEVLAKRGADILDPASVKEVVAKQNSWSEARKWQAVKAYSAFAKQNGLSWSPPRYKPVQKLPFIPTEQEIDQLIAGCPLQMATFLQLLKETGVRCGEAFNLKWKEVDLINKTIRITPEKFSNPRIFKISNKLATMLSNLPMKNEKVFEYKNKFYLRKAFLKQRKKTAFKLGNPRIFQIHFHTFRHWKATMEYAKTKDILHVMQLLGHKNIKNTLIYTQLVNFKEDEYVCKVAKTLDHACQLIEAGFEYVTDMDGIKLFRKRK